MKTVALWQAEKTIEDFEPRYRDCVESFLNDHYLEPATVNLVNGEQISCVLIGCEPHGHGLLVVRRQTAQTCMIRITHIESIKVR